MKTIIGLVRILLSILYTILLWIGFTAYTVWLLPLMILAGIMQAIVVILELMGVKQTDNLFDMMKRVIKKDDKKQIAEELMED